MVLRKFWNKILIKQISFSPVGKFEMDRETVVELTSMSQTSKTSPTSQPASEEDHFVRVPHQFTCTDLSR